MSQEEDITILYKWMENDIVISYQNFKESVTLIKMRMLWYKVSPLFYVH